MSLTTDSIAIARMSPSWCSVASVCRVPKMTAKVASSKATSSEISSTKKVLRIASMALASTMADSELETAFSCSAI
jgi:hypothetical protein